MNSIEPITVDLIRSLHGLNKSKALRQYHTWLNEQREQDYKIIKHEKAIINTLTQRIKYPEKYQQRLENIKNQRRIKHFLK